MIKFGPNWLIWPNIGNVGPFPPMPDQKIMQTRCLGGFSLMWVLNLLLSPVKIRIFGQKTTKFGPKFAFLVILGQILAFFPHLIPCLTKKNANNVPRWFFRYVGTKTFASSHKNQDFWIKKAKFGRKYTFWSFWAKYWHFWSIWSHARPKNNANKVPRQLFN